MKEFKAQVPELLTLSHFNNLEFSVKAQQEKKKKTDAKIITTTTSKMTVSWLLKLIQPS